MLARRREAVVGAHGTAHPPDPRDAMFYRCTWRETARSRWRIIATIHGLGFPATPASVAWRPVTPESPAPAPG